MATKKCSNGHQYDSGIYGDNCPFCPSSGNETRVNDPLSTERTRVAGDIGGDQPTETFKSEDIHASVDAPGGATVIRHVTPSGETGLAGGNRRLVGMLVSYNQNPMGEVYKIYEGRNIIGRAVTSDIPLPGDSNVSSQHLLILYREAEGVFWAADQNSSNGTYINGSFISDRVKLNTNDLIVIGATKFVFLAVPQ